MFLHLVTEGFCRIERHQFHYSRSMQFLKKMKMDKLTYTMSSANFGVFSCAICLGLHLEWMIKLTLITVDHSAMLFGQHRSFQLFSNQWFEASHKEQRRFCYQATNHNSSADGQSTPVILNLCTSWLEKVFTWRGDWFQVNAIPITMARKIKQTGNER
ncbi:PREDICTED: uncharacterized protein LOC107328228 isoform X2 [Acropora digitifera]|uniref:uncharacterized protein LOC107328228 isoform X2 n=1 Tax=Acropora digitifera TaxID=70779 RepID=UPI00077AA6C5|nr:PREDICTED: uncharacterized protein LOC107328228 isoform X2 [Acropora digitifera]